MIGKLTNAVVSASAVMSHPIRSGQFLYGFIFVGLWGIFVVIDRHVIGMGLPYLMEDHETGWFATGLNWLTLEPRLWTSHPSPFFNQISGLLVLFLDIDGTDKPIRQFANLVIVLQGAVAVAAGIWFSWASDLIGLNRWHRALLILLIFTFPTLVFLSGHGVHSYVIGLFGLPLGITLFAVLQENKSAIKIGGLGLGFMAGNYYPAILILVLFTLALWLQRNRVFGFSFKKQKWFLTRHVKATIVLLGACAVAFTLGIYFFGLPRFGETARLFVLTGVGESILFALTIWLTLSFLVLIVSKNSDSIGRFFLWVVSGFVAGNSILLPWYFHGVILAEEKRKPIGLIETVDRLITTPLDYPWLLVVWVTILSMCFLVLWVFSFGKRNSSLKQISLVYGAMFVVLSTIGIAVFSVGAMKLPFGGWQAPGIAERIFVTAIPSLIIGWIILFRSLRGAWLGIFQITLILISLFSLAHFYQAYSGQVTENKYDGLVLDGAIDAFFQQYPDSRLVCVKKTYFSRYCMTAQVYSYKQDKHRLNPFWSSSGAKDLPPTWRLFNGRVIGLNVAPTEGNAFEYNPSVVENRLKSCSSDNEYDPISGFCYGDYVRSQADLLAAFYASDSNVTWLRKVIDRGQSIEEWGKTHYESFGQVEGRELPTPLASPLFVVTEGGNYRDSLIEFFGENRMKTVPLWQWWEQDRKKRGRPFTNISPGDSFLVFPEN
jgi:hypothetical protein